jgi:uncharacterized protein DUF5946
MLSAMGGDGVGMARCPGCGVAMPGSAEPWDPRSTASEACHQLYGEVVGYELQHVAELGNWHQLLADAYAAQHAARTTPAISVAFALIGLCLALVDGWGGIQVRDAHQRLATAYHDWPTFSVPTHRGDLTIVDVALAASPAEHVERLRAWAASVWAAWSGEHERVERLILERSVLEDPPAR